MPLLFCLGQHQALEAAQRQLRDGERLLALLDDICGTVLAQDQSRATFWRELFEWGTLRLLCGLGLASQHTSRVSRFWVPHWVTPISLLPICNEFAADPVCG